MKHTPFTLSLSLILLACGDDSGGESPTDAGTLADSGVADDAGEPPEDPRCTEDGCASCADVLAFGCDPALLCMPSGPVFGALFTCVCMGACEGPCTDNACAGEGASPDCQSCLGESCGAETAACMAD
jgi:hypothetical protein